MTMLAAYEPRMTFEPPPVNSISLHDRVSVPNGSAANVIGFYRRVPETVLVRFDSGGIREFAPTDLQRLG